MKFFDSKKNTHAYLLSTEKYLEKHKISSNAIVIHIVVDEKIESTQDYLEKLNIKSDAITTEIDLRTAEAKHRLTSRTIVLLSLVVPMAIAPFWLMILLSLPAFDKKPYSEAMQVAFLAGLVSDFAGLYYVITQDLFPQGTGERRRRSKSDVQEPTEADNPP